jgi:DNA-binding MarR family transcriptional regulator
MQPTRAGGDPLERIERELTVIVRRAQRVGRHGEGPALPLDRATYSILGRLHDEGPMRLSDLASCFHLDPSTVSRQVAAVVRSGLAVREADPRDGRAHRLRITSRGEELLVAARAVRRRVFREVLNSWPHEDRLAFASLLERFNAGLSERFDQNETARATPAQHEETVDS